MDISFQGIGEWAATFTGSGLEKGQVVKPGGGGAALPCGDGENFCSVALQCGGGLCAVQLGGLARVRCSGEVPAPGFVRLAGDGEGGVKTVAQGGREYLVLMAEGETLTIRL